MVDIRNSAATLCTLSIIVEKCGWCIVIMEMIWKSISWIHDFLGDAHYFDTMNIMWVSVYDDSFTKFDLHSMCVQYSVCFGAHTSNPFNNKFLRFNYQKCMHTWCMLLNSNCTAWDTSARCMHLVLKFKTFSKIKCEWMWNGKNLNNSMVNVLMKRVIFVQCAECVAIKTFPKWFAFWF